MQEIKNTANEKMQKAVDSILDKLRNVTPDRQSSILDNLTIDYYGSQCPLYQVADVSSPNNQSVMIQPYDKAFLKKIEEVIFKANIGVTPTNDGKTIRVRFPDLTQDRRNELVKKAKSLIEDGKISIRSIRKNTNDELKKLSKDKVLSKDDFAKAELDIQNLTDSFISKLDTLFKNKEKLILGK